MRVLIGGSSGLVGSALVRSLADDDHEVVRLVRKQPSINSPNTFWNPSDGQLDTDRFNGSDAVVHLSGRNLASALWTNSVKQELRDSRIKSTDLLSHTLARCASPPPVLVVASAVGYYGNRGDEILDERSEPGSGFMAELCRDWEAAAAPATKAGIRVVNLRIGLVLSRHGGLLKKLLPSFRLGLGGTLGDGTQYMSWVTLDDLVRVIRYAIDHDSLSGSVNAVAPEPVTNAEFTRTLAGVLRRPSFLKVPSLALRMLPGDMAEEAFLASARVIPNKLVECGFGFDQPELKSALVRILGGGVS